MWPSWGAFLTDIWKKLLVSVVAAPILSVATFVYAKTIVVGISSFSNDWFDQYFYLVIAAFVLSLLQAYILYKRRTFFAASLIVTLSLIAFFSLYRLNALPILAAIPLTVYFFVFYVILFRLLVILLFIAWRILANILA